MKKIIGIILWLPITLICLIGNLMMWIGAQVSGIAFPVLGVMFALAVITKNLYGIGIIGGLIILTLISLFGLAAVTGQLESVRDKLVRQ